MVGFTDDKLFDFIELVDTKNTPGVLAVSTSLLAEAGTEADEGHRQLVGTQDLVFKHASNRYFSCAYEKGILSLNSIDLVASLGKLAATDKTEVAGHSGYDERCKALACNLIDGKIHQGQLQASGIAFEYIAAAARNFYCPLD